MEDKELNIVDHLDELRTRLIVTVAAFIIFFVVGFIYVEEIYKFITKDLDVKLIVLGPSDIIWVYFMIAAVIAVAGTIPVLATQVWFFVKPALKPIERKISLILYSGSFYPFYCGIGFWLFCYLSNDYELFN